MKKLNLWSQWTALCLALLLSSCEDILREIERPNGEPEDDTESLLPDGFRDQFADVNGISLHYVIGGQGDPVVLLHGWPQTWYEWHRIMPELAENYTVVVPDLRGSGKSDIPATDSNGYPKSLLAEDIHQLVQQLGYESIKLVGHDVGAMVAYAHASLYPDEVEQLVIMDVVLPGIEPVWSMALADEALWHFSFHQEQGSENIIAGDEKRYLNTFFDRFSFDPDQSLTEQEREVFVEAYTGVKALRGGFDWYRGFPTDEEEFSVFAETPLRMPVLGMGGSAASGPLMEPLLSPVADTTQLEIVVLSETGHWLVEEQPETVLQELMQFFSDNVNASRDGN